jgi:hypothetical protein
METLNQENGQIITNFADSNQFRPHDQQEIFEIVTQRTKILIAVINPQDFIIEYGNQALCNLVEINNFQDYSLGLGEILNNFDLKSQEKLYRRHLLALVLRDVYNFEHNQWRFLDEPLVTTLNLPKNKEERYLQFWLRSQQLKVKRIDPNLDEFVGIDFATETIIKPEWEQQLLVENYQVEGKLLWEGLDITDSENIQRIISLLLEKESLFQAKKILRLQKQMKNLFRSNNMFLMSMQREQIQLFTIINRQVKQSTLTFEKLQSSPCINVAESNQVATIPNLATDCQTVFEKGLLDQGNVSVLLIPLVATSEGNSGQQHLMGLVGITSDRPHNFDPLDLNHATRLIPALRVAFRQAVQVQFSPHIHAAVEWRFLQEAERRSWGLPATPIVFHQVYPLYGISDIRGSSTERNRAIQLDLLEQFRLGLAILDAIIHENKIPFLEELKLDLQAYIERLETEIKVEDEVTALQWLKANLEAYFDYFSQCNLEAQAAVETYLEACNNEHRCVYKARNCYDDMIHDINTVLRKTWERWQEKMQGIIPHYCDLELTDGLDHIIYVGSSINPKFTRFHLHALRYEQLRAICDCARTCFQFRDHPKHPIELTHLVLVQDIALDIFHDEQTEKLFDVKGTKDTRYEIVKKRIDKGVDAATKTRITLPGMLTIVYSTEDEWTEYRQYLRYLIREGWIDSKLETGIVEPLQGVTGLKFARARILG